MVGEPRRVLVVEDDAVTREVLDTVLDLEEFDVVTAEDGESALDLLSSPNQVDVVVLDVMMPGIDGFEVCARIKGDPRTGGIPVIMLTAKASPQDRKAGMRAGCDEYLTKPFSPRALIERIHALSNGSG
jgi:two-component system, cell cycle response regulator